MREYDVNFWFKHRDHIISACNSVGLILDFKEVVNLNGWLFILH